MAVMQVKKMRLPKMVEVGFSIAMFLMYMETKLDTNLKNIKLKKKLRKKKLDSLLK